MQDETELGRMIIAVAPAIRDDMGPDPLSQGTYLDPAVVEHLARYYVATDRTPDYVLKNGRELGAYEMYKAAQFFAHDKESR